MTAAIHSLELGNALLYGRQLAPSSSSSPVGNERALLHESSNHCLSAIRRGIPCGRKSNEALGQFIMSRQWRHESVLRALWQSYLDAGMFVDDRLDILNLGPALPLEAAALNENLETFSALIEAGADVAKVPSRTWSTGKAPAITDLEGLILSKVGPALAGPMIAIVTEARMSSRIAAAPTAERPSTVTPTRSERLRV